MERGHNNEHGATKINRGHNNKPGATTVNKNHHCNGNKIYRDHCNEQGQQQKIRASATNKGNSNEHGPYL
jgi:hypothetical protein